MKKNKIVRFGSIFLIIFLLFGISIFSGVTAEKKLYGKLLNNKNSSLTDNETEYWGVCVVAFENFSIQLLDSYIYDSLLESDNWNESHLKLLYGENATRSAILDAIDWLIENADEDDVVLFADNSHGLRKGIVPIDSQESGIITIEELDEKFDMIKANKICLIFDCCLSGSFVNRPFINSLDGENRVVLMSTRRWGTGFAMSINESGEIFNVTFSRFVGEAISKKIDYNDDGFCSAEESFQYARKKWRPFALLGFFMLKLQIVSFLNSGYFTIPFPTIYDGFSGELQLIPV